MKTNLCRLWVWLCVAHFLIFTPGTQAAQPVPPRDRILILLSLDAFRWDYLQKFHPTNLSKLAAEGVHV
jgi:predicted AlkP superfamily pyrophosphatase or phosphodiesterase